MDSLSCYRQAWAVDFEFTAPPGNRPVPICCVARELRTGKLVRLWLADGAPDLPPYGTEPDSLFVAYYASAELGCHIALGWPPPIRILDLYVEFRHRTSGLPVPCGNGLLGALAYHGLDGLSASEKEEMRQLAIRGGPFTPAEQTALLDYCQSDVDSLARLLPAMLPKIDLSRALLRGRFMTSAARMEWTGIPIDVEALQLLRQRWDRIKSRLIQEIDQDYGVFIPSGQRTINPDSVLGSAILTEAEHYGINPHRLAEAVDYVWREERSAIAELHDAREAARKATGLTYRQIDKWEDAGKDSSLFPELDQKARELAGTYPALGIGSGYDRDSGYDDTDYGGRLWDVLRNRNDIPKPRHHPDILRRAAEQVAAGPADTGDVCCPLTFSGQLWAEYLTRKGIPWPRLESGALALDDDTFKEMARAFPAEIGPIREVLRIHRGELKKIELTVGTDGRNRFLLSAFSSKTSRNQPSNTKSIFGPSAWLRSLIRPEAGRAVAYVDWSQQELAIAAALSRDTRMQDAYLSGDFYLSFAKMANAVPAEATKQSHSSIRDQFKIVALGVLYGLSEKGLARKLNVSVCRGRELLRMHKETFRQFWAWSDKVEMQAMLVGRLNTVFGWQVHVPTGLDPKTGRPLANPRSLRNFPMQGNGAEMMRLACCLVTEQGINLCAPIHDALLVEGPSEEIEDVVARTQAAMRKASEIVLDGFSLRTDAKIVRFPDRFTDERGLKMWNTVWGLLCTLEIDLEPLSPVIGVAEGTPITGDSAPLLPVIPPPSLMSCI
jgi:DNA polymerase family A